MKATLLVKRFPKLSETFILNEILALESAGVALSIRYLQPPSDEIVHPDVSLVRARAAPLGAGKLPPFLRQRPFSFLRVVLDALVSHGAGALTLCRQAASLAGAAQTDDADIIYAHFIDRPAAIARLASRLSGIPFAISAHAKDIYTTPSATLRRHLEAAAFTTTCSDQNAAYLKNIAPKAEIVRHYHGIDPAIFAGARTPSGERAPLILAVGRLREKKGFDTLIAACGLLRTRGVAFRCAIAGYGPEEARLRRQIAAAQLDSFVLLTGKQPHQEIVRLMRDAAVFALPCRIDAYGDRDGVPNVILEAMASGLPVVSTQVSGVPEAVLHEETGLLVEPDDPAALAACLERFLRNPKLAGEFGERARARAVNAFASRANLPGLIADLRRRRSRRAVDVAYIVKGFPRLSESFITNEILVLESEGLSLSVYALKKGEKIAASAIRDMTGNVVYLPLLSSLSETALSAWLAQNIRPFMRPLLGLALRRPRSLFRTFRSAAGMMRHYRNESGALKKVFLKEFLQAAWVADALHRDGGARHLHGHFCHGATTVTQFVSDLTGIPFSFTAHAKDLYQKELNPGDLLERKMRSARFVVTCTGANRQHLHERCGEIATSRVHTIYHGLDIARFKPRPEAANEELFRILSVGRHVDKKGFNTLIEACELLKSRGAEFICDIVGEEGEATSALKAQISEGGLDEIVKLCPPAPQAKLAAIYASSSLFALPCNVLENGDRDGIPNVLAEAMATALPIVTTPISGIPEIVEHDVNGLFVEPGDAAALADAIELLMRDTSRRARLGAEARRTIRLKFDSRQTTRRLHQLFMARERAAAE